jgi:hypothetical protein
MLSLSILDEYENMMNQSRMLNVLLVIVLPEIRDASLYMLAEFFAVYIFHDELLRFKSLRIWIRLDTFSSHARPSVKIIFGFLYCTSDKSQN